MKSVDVDIFLSVILGPSAADFCSLCVDILIIEISSCEKR